MQQIDIKKLSGEELATLLAGQYEQLMNTKDNIRGILFEIELRKKTTKPEEVKTE